MKSTPVSERIEKYTERIPFCECHIWTGFTKGGYAAIQIGRRSVRVHRWQWEQRHGPLPKGYEVMHVCDNPLCVREDHHAAGTHQDNMADMKRKGRAKSGIAGRFAEAHPGWKLTPGQRAEVVRRRTSGERLWVLAEEFGVSEAFVSLLARGKRHGHA